VEPPTRFFVDADVPRVVLRLSPEAQWVLDQYPVDEVTELADPRGWVEARLPVSSERWLAKLLIRLGSGARVSNAADAAGAVDLARRMLDRYDT